MKNFFTMFTFYDIEQNLELKPLTEFETRLKIDPSTLITEQNTFAISLHKLGFNLYIKDTKTKIYRFTPDFRLKINLETAKNSEIQKIEVFSANQIYLSLLDELLSLEPCFKIKPNGIHPNELKKIIKNSSCTKGFIEIFSFYPEPIFEEIIIKNQNTYENLYITNLQLINKIIIYDKEKNSLLCNTINSQKEQNQPTDIIAELEKLLQNYFKTNISQNFPQVKIYDLKNLINKIKTNQKAHKEKIKELIAQFYSENYNELEKLNLNTTIEKLYMEI